MPANLQSLFTQPSTVLDIASMSGIPIPSMEAMFQAYNIPRRVTTQSPGPTSNGNTSPGSLPGNSQPLFFPEISENSVASRQTVDGADGLGLDGVAGDPSAGHQADSWVPSSMRDESMERSMERFVPDQQTIPMRRAADEAFADDIVPPAVSHRERGIVLSSVLRAETREKCKVSGLTEKQTEAVVDFSTMSLMNMMVDMKIHLYHIEKDVLQRYMRIFIAHPNCTLRLRHRVAGILLCAKVPVYICGIRAFVLGHIEKNLGDLLLPATCKDDPVDWLAVKGLVSEALSQCRYNIKAKLDLGVKNETEIYSLTAQIMMYDMKVKSEHWARVAFLRRCCVTWKNWEKERVTKDGKKVAVRRPSFWKHVDAELKKIRLASATGGADKETRQSNQTSFFRAILEADIEQYTKPGPEYYGSVYEAGDSVTLNQRIGEEEVERFTVDDNRALEADEDAE